jgi:hypothetical protein
MAAFTLIEGTCMRSNRSLAALMALGMLGCTYPLTAQTVCRPADATTARTVADIQTVVTSTDSTEMATRDSLRLTSTAASNVKLISTATTCQKGLDAFNATQQTPGRARLVYVYQIGKFYAVEDPLLEGKGESRAIRIYDSKWKYVSTMASF